MAATPLPLMDSLLPLLPLAGEGRVRVVFNR